MSNLSRAMTSRRNQFLVALLVCGLIGLAWVAVRHPLVGIAAGLAPLAVVFVLRNPFPMVLLFVLFSFFRLHEVFPQLGPLKLPLLLALAALGSLSWGLFNRQIPAFGSTELKAFAVFFALVTSGVFLASNPGLAMGAWSGTYVKIAIMVLAIAWLTNSVARFRALHYSVLLSGALVGIVALSNKAKGIGLVEGTRVTIGRDIGSMLGDPNDLALVLLLPASFAIALIVTRGIPRWGKLVGLVVFLIVASAIVTGTQSRGGLLGIVAVSGTFAWRMVRSKSLLIIGGGAALAVLAMMAGITDRQSGGAAEEGIDESAMGRIYAWGAAFQMALQHPFSGVGLNNFLANYWAYSSHWDGQNHAVHSTWFGVMGETGFAGLIAFVVMVVLTKLGALRTVQGLAPRKGRDYHPYAYAMAQGVQAGLMGFVVSGTFLTMGFVWPFYILLSLAVATGRFEQNERQRSLQSHNLSQTAPDRPGGPR